MSWLDIALLAALALWLAASIVWVVRRKGRSCCGDCTACNRTCKK